MKPSAFLNLLQICDPLFPIGGFTMSNGLETLVQREKITSSHELDGYLRDYLRLFPYNELGAAALAYRFSSDKSQVESLDVLMAAFRSPYELRTGSRRLCQRFFKLQESLQPLPSVQHYQNEVKNGRSFGVHAIAVGLFLADLQIPLRDGLTAFCYSTVSTMVTNTVKLVPLSQTEGQRVLNRLFPAMEAAVEKAEDISMDELGIGGAGFDLSSMEHETLYSRIYIN
ncbi:MAG: urease accessory protein UreF [Oscillospiraceae bacterium]|nr:urease accessory protein UreF [Oscillospiraceae bacterium]